MYPDQPQLNSSNDPFHTKRVDKAFELADASRSAMDALGKSYKADPRPNSESTPSYLSKMEENTREIRSNSNVSGSTKVSDLKDTEISGDALARAKKGQTPKLHRNV